ncbi:acetyltransferase [Bimuria novae-zelandiae CBS 107.79]|uniref:Acetyltransferase n=1 Tax=Bimuria novae-zelandiae CBS 107.79 TaxID=1447943 RepID=A0A6A5UPK1_9PLEO|nr:acetyltransferase [Bimuria novae-zelandiae CBS 107.79]
MTSNIELKFQVAVPEDANRIAHLVQAAFRAEDNGASWIGPDVALNRSFTMTSEEVLSTINNPNAACIMVTTSEDILVGVMAAIKRSDKLARLANLAVDQRYQRGGLGRRVLAHAEEYVQKKWGVEKIGLNALSTRSLLIEWYESRGYVRTGDKSPFAVERLEELGLSKDLHFVEMEKFVGGGKTGESV